MGRGNRAPGGRESRGWRWVLGCLAATLWFAGCSEAIELGRVSAVDAGGDVGGTDASDASDSGAGEVSEEARVALTIDRPTDGVMLGEAAFSIEGTATHPIGVSSVWVRVGPNRPMRATSVDGWKTWRLDAVAPPGRFEVRAWAWDVAGRRSDEVSVSLSRPDDRVDRQAPTVEIDSPADGSQASGSRALLRGRAEDDVAVVRMEVRVDGVASETWPMETTDGFRTWARFVPLRAGVENVVEVRAWDAFGRSGVARVTLRGRAERDESPPTLTIEAPLDGDTVEVDRVRVTGSAADDQGVRQVKLRVRAAGAGDDAWSPFTDATTTDGFGSWEAELAVTSGPIEVQARAIDVNGLATSREVGLTNVWVAEHGPERTVFLRVRDASQRPRATFVLDRPGIDEVIRPDIQEEILLLNLDSTGLLQNILVRIKDACGTRWREDNADPRHDCSLTPLGRTFRGSDGTWRTSAEYSMVRLLTMTPANVKVAGTSIAGLQELADGQFFGITIGGGFNQILAEALGIPRTQEIVPTDAAVAAFRDWFVSAHPAITPGGGIPVTMRDALLDLAPLAEKLGPRDGHPGILDPGFPPSATIFTADLEMLLVVESNLQWVDGVDLDVGKEYMARVVDTTGPNFDDVVEFDFFDPARFDIRGVVPNPTADLRFSVRENPSFLPSCNGRDACQANLPGAPVGTTSVWATPPWELEHVLVAASLTQYRDRVFRKCYIPFLGCQADVRIGQDGTPTGWTRFDVLLNLGNPPKDQYLWELIGEIGQIALHRFGSTVLPEGQANVAFTVENVGFGITADELRAAVRPFLQEQRSMLADRLLGGYRSNNGALDFFLMRGEEGGLYLAFVDPSDPLPRDDIRHATPGFFARPSFGAADRVSRRDVAGVSDRVHEKVRVTEAPQTWWVRDDADRTWRVTASLDPSRPSEVVVRIARRMVP